MTFDHLDYHEINLWARGSDGHGMNFYSKMALGPYLASLPPENFWSIVSFHAESLIGDLDDFGVPVSDIRWEVTVDLMTVRQKIEYTEG